MILLTHLTESDSGSGSESASASDESGSGSESEESGEETESEEEEEDEEKEKKRKKRLDKTKAKKPAEESAERCAIHTSHQINASYKFWSACFAKCLMFCSIIPIASRAAAPRTENEAGRQRRIRKVPQNQRANQKAATQRRSRRRSQRRSLSPTPTSGKRRLG